MRVGCIAIVSASALLACRLSQCSLVTLVRLRCYFAVQIALQLNSFDIAGAHKLLLEQGYIEVVNQQPQLKALPLPEALPPAASSSPPLALSLSERTYYRNQQIYDVSGAVKLLVVSVCLTC